MKKKLVTSLLVFATALGMLAGCGEEVQPVTEQQEEPAQEPATETGTKKEEAKEISDDERAKEVADLIDAIYVQERTDETDELCRNR